MKKHKTVDAVRERERERESNSNELGFIYDAKIIYRYKLKRIEYHVKQQRKKLHMLHDTLSFL